MILILVNEQICREIALPDIVNTDYRIHLPAERFRLREDLNILLENTGGFWEITGSEKYSIRAHSRFYSRYRMTGGESVRIGLAGGGYVGIHVIDQHPDPCSMQKFEVDDGQVITIGRKAGNTIRYEEGVMVSGTHAVLTRDGGRWLLQDRSTNGVFVDHCRIPAGKHVRIGNGTHIEMFGLHLICMGRYLLAGSSCDKVEADPQKLHPMHIPPFRKELVPAVRKAPEQFFNRSPRNIAPVYCEKIEIESPPEPKKDKQKPMLMVIGPSFTMAIPMLLGCLLTFLGARGRSGAFMFTGVIMACGAGIFGAIWAAMNLRYNKEQLAEEEDQRFNAYSNYLMQMAARIDMEYKFNREAMNATYPAPDVLLSYRETSPGLWNRNLTHGDFLYHRLGLGDQPFQVEITIPKNRFTLVNDALAEEPGRIREKYRMLHGVPVGLDLLQHRLIGLVGGKGCRGAVELMHVLTAEIAANNCYTDVKLVYIYNEKDPGEQDWECMRWFPHTWSDDGSIRFMASCQEEYRDVFFALSNILRGRIEAGSKDTAGRVHPHYVLFISNPDLLEGELLTKYIYEAKPRYGITSCIMVEHASRLPNSCEMVIENTKDHQGFYNLMETDRGKRHTFVPDHVTREQLERAGKRFANIHVRELEISSEIPSSLSFFEMYEAEKLEDFHVLERWRRNRTYQSMRALIGRRSGGQNCYLDIHEKFHGPHGLVAGTTGSGKSETLQTYILSLALNFSPEDVSFFIIDFKGGGMANLFSNLPHLSGEISNLSGNQITRAMISIQSENHRRQRIFAAHNVNTINLYTRLYKNKEASVPIPHLFIIIDEFAELKREEPDFMQELISVAQVGRSLGVHLILATQKPSGTVDDNIWSNSKFRLCLRVQDRQDSMDMLHKPDAAFLTQAGRCYLQVGNDEIYELFQSGYSGAPYNESGKTRASGTFMLSHTGRMEEIGKGSSAEEEIEGVKSGKTQLEAVIGYLRDTAARYGYKRSPQLWLPVLGTRIILDSLREGKPLYDGNIWPEMRIVPGAGWKIETETGLYDDPEYQKQAPLTVSFPEGGHLAVIGGASSGKSTFLQTLIYGLITSYAPQILNLYILDYSSHMLSPFAEAPHVGGVVTDNQEDRTGKFFHMMGEILEERKNLLKGGNFEQYMQIRGPVIPAILIVIDNYASFREKTASKYDDSVMRILREGMSCGIYFVTASQSISISDIPTRMADNIRTIIALEQADRFKYSELMRRTRLRILPEANTRGRGLAAVDNRVFEFQTALALDRESDFEKGRAIEALAGEMARVWTGKRARPIPEIPANAAMQDLEADERYQNLVRQPSRLPFGWKMEDASIWSFDLSVSYCLTIGGKARTGKTNALRAMMLSAAAGGGDLCVIEKQSDTPVLKKTAEDCGALYVDSGAALADYIRSLTPEFVRRNKRKQELIAKSLDEEGIYQSMSSEKRIFIFIGDLSDFMQMVYRPEENVARMSDRIENFLEKGRLHNIYFIGCVNTDEYAMMTGYRAFSLFTAARKGIYLGGSMAQQRLFDFQNIPFKQQQKSLKKGRGYAADDHEEGVGIEIVVPLVK